MRFAAMGPGRGDIRCSGTAQKNDWLIVPGQRVGPVTATTTRADLDAIFGKENVQERNLDVTAVRKQRLLSIPTTQVQRWRLRGTASARPRSASASARRRDLVVGVPPVVFVLGCPSASSTS